MRLVQMYKEIIPDEMLVFINHILECQFHEEAHSMWILRYSIAYLQK
jgi:hypothetical protein